MLVQVHVLHDTTQEGIDELKRIISAIDPALPLWRKCRMILALRELQPLKAIDIAGETDFAEEDKYDVSVLLQWAIEMINIFSLNQDALPQTQQDFAITPFFFTTTVEPLPDSSSSSGTVSPTSFPMSPASPASIHSLRASTKPYTRVHFTPMELVKMGAFFDTVSTHPSHAQIEMMASEFGREDSRSVKIWFKNKRAKQARIEKRTNAALPTINL